MAFELTSGWTAALVLIPLHVHGVPHRREKVTPHGECIRMGTYCTATRGLDEVAHNPLDAPANKQVNDLEKRTRNLHSMTW